MSGLNLPQPQLNPTPPSTKHCPVSVICMYGEGMMRGEEGREEKGFSQYGWKKRGREGVFSVRKEGKLVMRRRETGNIGENGEG